VNRRFQDFTCLSFSYFRLGAGPLLSGFF